MDINRTNSVNNTGTYYGNQAQYTQPNNVANNTDYGSAYGFTLQDLATPMGSLLEQVPNSVAMQQAVKNAPSAATVASAMNRCASPMAGLSGFPMLRYFVNPTNDIPGGTTPTDTAHTTPVTATASPTVQPTAVNPDPVMVQKAQATQVERPATQVMPPSFPPPGANQQPMVQQTMGMPMGAPMGTPMGTPMGGPMGAPMGGPMGAPLNLTPDMTVSQKITALYNSMTMIMQQQQMIRDSIHAKRQQISDGNMGRILHTEDPGATRARNEDIRRGIMAEETQLNSLKFEIQRIEAQINELRKLQR